MSNLNSILLEGTVATQIAGLGDEAFFDVDGGEVRITVWAGAKLADRVQDRLGIGAKIRVVGKLRQSEEGAISIAADHIEFVPRFMGEGVA
jgi:hypothetical protein